MREYVKNVGSLWQQFQKTNPDEAKKLRDVLLGICADMSSANRKRQIEAMLASGNFTSLRAQALKFAGELGIREDSDAEFALWIRTVCFCDVMKAEMA